MSTYRIVRLLSKEGADNRGYQRLSWTTVEVHTTIAAMDSFEHMGRIRAMDEEMERLIGRKVFGYVSRPTQTTVRLTFGNEHVCFSYAEADAYMVGLLETARRDTNALPWPFCEPMPS